MGALGFAFCLGNVSDIDADFAALSERSFRFLKVGAGMFLAGASAEPAEGKDSEKGGVTMGMKVGINMEFIRRAEKPFKWGVAKAAEIGYKYCEPMVHTGRELMSEAGYYHTVSMLEDPLEIREILEKHGLQASGLSCHCPLARPEVSVDYIKQAIRFAAQRR